MPQIKQNQAKIKQSEARSRRGFRPNPCLRSRTIKQHDSNKNSKNQAKSKRGFDLDPRTSPFKDKDKKNNSQDYNSKHSKKTKRRNDTPQTKITKQPSQVKDKKHHTIAHDKIRYNSRVKNNKHDRPPHSKRQG
jgi:hypothetical protein